MLPARRELTYSAIVLGLLLSVVMGAANVYLGLRVGMTVSASIPAAVIAMALLNGLLRRDSILEANLVQTSASAGESLAAGIIFTMPALIIAGIWTRFDYWTTTLIAFTGGLLGILLMIPMRKVFVVDSRELQFPEGLACAEVLKTGAGGDDTAVRDTGAALIFSGLAVGAAFKFVQSFLGLFQSSVEWAMLRGQRVFFFGSDVAPALLGVGLIVGLPIALQIFTGGAIAWLIAIPLLDATAYASETPVDSAYGLWSDRVRYMGVGAMVVGGIVSIWKVRAGLAAAVAEMWAQFQPQQDEKQVADTERNLGTGTIVLLATVTVMLVAGIYFRLLQSVPVTLLTTAIMLVMAFFFSAVASYIVGLVGNSNSPVSGMTITAVLGTGGLIYLFNWLGVLETNGEAAIIATLGVAGIVCCVACTSGDVCNDLKTGHLVGASPRLQQIVQVGGVFVAAFVMAPVMTALHEGSLKEGTGGIGGKELPAPQAVLFSKLADGFFGDGALPWEMIGWGIGIGLLLLAADVLLHRLGAPFRLHVMPVAVGMYLPFGLSVPIALGGLMHFGLSRPSAAKTDAPVARRPVENGTLVASGVIAGESLVGVLLGFLAYYGIKSPDFVATLGWSEMTATAVSAGALLAVAAWMLVRAARRRAPS